LDIEKTRLKLKSRQQIFTFAKKWVMITFLISVLMLILGYFLYGKFIERHFEVDANRQTPAVKINDGVDFVPMPLWKVFMIQFLNIAGLGPIFGAVLGAMYGPMAYLWIVFGCIFMGATHDYFSGMLSLRENGLSLPELVGKYLGKYARPLLAIFTIVLLIFVGVAFVSGPAKLLNGLTGGNILWWIYIIFSYYLLATLLPINKIIGKLYPFFGGTLLIMALGILGAMIYHSMDGTLHLQELSLGSFKNFHHDSEENLLFPMMFIVISCGAISGFHATQSPMMARCLTNEKYGRPAFYGAMIAEGIVALIWATVAMNFFGGVESLNRVLTSPISETNRTIADPSWVVNYNSHQWLGTFGATLAIIGVVACPITTGDTAFRSARLIIADAIGVPQKKLFSRVLLSIPLFMVAMVLTFEFKDEFQTVWRYVGISNQLLAVVVLWTIAVYLAKNNKRHWLMSVPATFLTIVCISYLMVAPLKSGGMGFPSSVGIPIGIVSGLFSLVIFLFFAKRKQ